MKELLDASCVEDINPYAPKRHESKELSDLNLVEVVQIPI